MKAFNFFRKQRGHNVPDEHYQGWESHHRADFDPSSDTLCSDPLQRQYPRGRAVHSVYGGIPYYGVPPGYPHVHPEVMLRVVPGMTMPPPGLDSRFYQSPIDMMHDPAHSYAPPTGANLPAGDAHGRSFNPHPLNTGPHPRSSSGSSDPPLSATSTAGPGWSPTRASTERRFPVATTFTLADYESLRRYDLVFLVCNTPSMNQNGKWQQCGELLTQLTRIAIQYDSDGVDIYYLNTDSERSEQTFTSEEDVQEMFQRVTPSGGFRISDKLDPLMKAYRSQLQEYIDSKPARRWLTAQTPKRAIFIVITDGNYSDGDNLKSHIVKMAQYLDEINAPDTQFGIQFVQIGEGNEFFEWLDREMYVNEKVRDIVRTDKYRGGTLDEFQLGALLLGSVSGNATS